VTVCECVSTVTLQSVLIQQPVKPLQLIRAGQRYQLPLAHRTKAMQFAGVQQSPPGAAVSGMMLQQQQQQQQHPHPYHPGMSLSPQQPVHPAMKQQHMQVPQSQPPQSSVFCGVIASGRPVVMDFVPVGNNRYAGSIPQPGTVPELTFFMLPSFQAALQHGMGLSLYCCKDGMNWQLLGSLTGQKTSDVFRTGWPNDSDLTNASEVKIGIAIEPLGDIQKSVGLGSFEVSQRLNEAQFIARDLYRYMESFTQRHHQNGQEYLILPTNCINKWIQRFERKYRRDPTFFMKETT